MNSIPTVQPAVVREINPEGLVLKCMYNLQNRINTFPSFITEKRKGFKIQNLISKSNVSHSSQKLESNFQISFK